MEEKRERRESYANEICRAIHHTRMVRRERKRIAFSLPSIASSFADYIFNAYREKGGRAKGESEAFNLGFSLLDPYSDDSYLRDVTVLLRERQLSDFPLLCLGGDFL